MTDKAPALPALPVGISSAEPDERQKYNESIQKVLTALEGRSQVPWFQMAAAFADPGRTGSAMEGFGRGMGVLGKYQEEERARELPVAQMRAQLAGQQYEISKEARGMQMISQALGVSPDKLQEGMSSAVGNPAVMQRLMAIAPGLSGKPLEMAKTLFNMNKDMQELVFKQMEAGVKPAEILLRVPGAEAILRSLNALPPGYKGTTGAPSGAPSGTPSGAPSTAPETVVAPTTAPKGATTGTSAAAPAGRDPNLIYDDQGNVVDVKAQPAPEDSEQITIQGQPVSRPKKEAAPAPATAPAQGSSVYKQFDGTPIDISGIPPAEIVGYVKEQQKLYEDRVRLAETETAASYKKKMETVANLDPASLQRNNKDLNQVMSIIEDPKMQPYMGQLYKKGFIPGMLTAFDEVFKVGPFSASVPAYKVWLNQQPEWVQEKIRNLDRYLGAAYINAVSAKPFGGAPSNFEDIAIRNTIATARDPASVIKRFVEEQKLTNSYLANVRSGYDTFNNKKPKDMAPYKYFVTDAYKNYINDYNKNYDALMSLRGGQ